ncbi:cingulin-like [Anguilla rostrata]|uniref:cingulin-like n=1 Tax=Anguilla rostrata TaxID=7938 RepID=UPI0030CACE8E
MSTLSAERKAPLDYGVQIRFINDLQDSGGGYPLGPRGGGGGVGSPLTSPTSKYGVAVRVQGIAGQPYVVLKEGEKGDSYGVQLKSEAPPPAPPPTSYSLPRRKEERGGAAPAQPLGRAHSQDSLLERRAMADFRGLVARPPGDGRSGSHGALDGAAAAGGGEKAALNGEAGLRAGEGRGLPAESFPDPPPPVAPLDDGPSSAVDTHSLAPINRLISKFGGGGGDGSAGPPRGRSKPQLRPKPGALDVHDGVPEALAPPPLPSLSPSPSPVPNPYGSSPPPSSASSCSSLGRSYRSSSKAMSRPLASTPPSSWSAGRVVAKETPQIAQTEKQVTPDLLRDQGQSSEVASKEERTKQAIYSILKEGSSESAAATNRKVDLILEKLQDLGVSQGADPTMKAELEECLEENLRLQEQLDRKKAELHQTHSDVTQLRMEREAAELRGRVLEDQLAQQQEDLRRAAEDAAQTETLHTELSGEAQLRQRLEDALRQRERELTALKGALKDEVATHDQEIEALREQYALDMERLRSSMEQVAQSQQGYSVSRLLCLCRLLQARLEKEEFEEELKELQERLNSMKEQIPDSSHAQTLTQDLYQCQDSLKRARSDLEQLRIQLDRKGAELLSLKKASEDREAEQSREIDRLKQQSQGDREELAQALEKAKQPAAAEAGWEAERLRDRLAATQRELQAQKAEQQELQETNTRLRDKITRLEARLESSSSQSSEAELALEEENKGLRAQLEEARRGAARLGQEREELSRRLEERDREREGLKRGKSELEEQKRLLDRSLEKIGKEMEQLSSESRLCVQGLQAQLEEYRERSRKELQDAQRQGKDRLNELQRAQGTARSLQEELLRLKKELLLCSEQRDSAQLEKELLSNRLKHSEEELGAEKSLHGDRSREIRALEDQVKQLELDLDEEKTNAELLSDRATRSRDQVDQLRSELMQERACRQDVEVDKSVLERQLKELRGRLADVEGQTARPSTGVSQLETKVQELEERLHSEEREKSSLQAAQRRMERRLKELNIIMEEERQRQSEQKDQLALRVKALKRQVDEREGEVERLEGLRRKGLREAEEHLEQMDVLQARVSTLEAELKRKAQQSRRPILSSADDEGLDDTFSIASLLS